MHLVFDISVRLGDACFALIVMVGFPYLHFCSFKNYCCRAMQFPIVSVNYTFYSSSCSISYFYRERSYWVDNCFRSCKCQYIIFQCMLGWCGVLVKYVYVSQWWLLHFWQIRVRVNSNLTLIEICRFFNIRAKFGTFNILPSLPYTMTLVYLRGWMKPYGSSKRELKN